MRVRGRAASRPRAGRWQSRCHWNRSCAACSRTPCRARDSRSRRIGVPRARRVRRAARGRNDTAGTALAFARAAPSGRWTRGAQGSRGIRFGGVGERRRPPVVRRSRAARSSAVTLAIRPARFRGGSSPRGEAAHRSLCAAPGAGVLSFVPASRCANPVGGGAGGGRGSLYPPVVKVAGVFQSETHARAPCARAGEDRHAARSFVCAHRLARGVHVRSDPRGP
jgi:hypothetical protein